MEIVANHCECHLALDHTDPFAIYYRGNVSDTVTIEKADLNYTRDTYRETAPLTNCCQSPPVFVTLSDGRYICWHATESRIFIRKVGAISNPRLELDSPVLGEPFPVGKTLYYRCTDEGDAI
jgi:hypothetical protein